MHATKPPRKTSTDTLATLVLDEVLDAASCGAMRRFRKRTQRVPRCDAAIDLRRTRRTASQPWATLVKLVRDLAYGGHEVTVFAGERLVRLLEVTGLARHARVVIVGV
ncbi:MAG: hypothetical protein M3Z41_07330 [Candidatus Eremiobacteraeota bacterium]|nr:hypothetical protein [Candidatus Eremiobacteraeota bacterium]